MKAKKKQLSEFSQKKQSEKRKKSLNPFEIHINRDKQNVLGRKSKVDRGLPGVSRAKAIKKRKGTLLQEYKLKHKDNIFLDKRIGEKNHTMTEEDKAMARFAAERMKSHKKSSIYNLNDEEKLTHRGQTLEEIEKFDDPKSDDEFSDDENKTGRLDDKFVDEAHFGGGMLSKSGSGQSRKDLIEQLIAESKKRKAEKQKIREQTLDLTEKLDSEWKDLLPIVSEANKALEVIEDLKKADDYDITVRQLKFNPRGNPSDKLKSEEDIVREEKEKLEALENDRLARMKGFINNSGTEIKHKSADDLDDGFITEKIRSTEEDKDNDEKHKSDSDSDNESNANDNETENNNIEEERNSDAGDLNDERNIESQKSASDNESPENALSEESDVDNAETDDSDVDNLSDLKESDSETDSEPASCKKTVRFGSIDQQTIKTHSEVKSILKTKSDTTKEVSNNNRQNEIREDLLKRKEIMEKARKELPYTYKIPESLEEFIILLENERPEYQSVIIDRIIKCNHWSLKSTNKGKLSNLFSYLLHHLDAIMQEANEENIVNCFKIVDRLIPHLYDLGQLIPENTNQSVQELLKAKHEDFEKNKKIYPNLDTLLLFKIVSILFPTSDFRHPIVTPCLIFMSQILLCCRIKNRIDMSKGLFICTLMLEYTAMSKRFSPATINFLRGVIYNATPKHLIQGVKVVPPFKSVGDFSNLLIINKLNKNFNIDHNGIHMRATDLVTDDFDTDFSVRALLTALNLLKEFKCNFEELDAAYLIFEPILQLLKPNKFEGYPKNVKTHIKDFQKELELLKTKKLEYIVLQKKKPKPLKMYEPRIEKVYDGKKHKPMSKEKAEREKLLHKYKKEMKGAIREIRRDRSFLAKVQIKQQIKSDEERKRKVKEIFGEAAVQQSEFKKMKRKK